MVGSSRRNVFGNKRLENIASVRLWSTEVHRKEPQASEEDERLTKCGTADPVAAQSDGAGERPVNLI